MAVKKYKQKNKMQICFTEKQMAFLDRIKKNQGIAKTEIVRRMVDLFVCNEVSTYIFISCIDKLKNGG